MRCEPIADQVDPLELGLSTGLLWSRPERVIGGVGQAARIDVQRPDGGAAAQAKLAEIANHEPANTGHANGETTSGLSHGAVALAALPFDRTAPGELIVPAVTAVRDSNGQTTLIFDDAMTLDQAIALATDAIESKPSGPQPTTWELHSMVPPETWRDEIVATTRNRISAGEFRKVVLARELQVRADAPIDISAVLRRLHSGYGTATIFAVDGFIGATPELLVGRLNQTVHAHPLAGTAPRSSDPATDERLAQELTASTKNQTEHLITIDWLLNTLLPYCSYVDAEPEPSIVTLPNVHHLGTRVEGLLSSPSASILELVAALHPTPALGGDPQSGALDVIDTIEPGDRGCYGGPVGWIDAQGNGEFAVGIRSGTIRGPNASVWAGVGVVGDSDPEAELAETRTKFQAMLGALVQP